MKSVEPPSVTAQMSAPLKAPQYNISAGITLGGYWDGGPGRIGAFWNCTRLRSPRFWSFPPRRFKRTWQGAFRSLHDFRFIPMHYDGQHRDGDGRNNGKPEGCRLGYSL
jgi:hypothetical protein